MLVRKNKGYGIIECIISISIAGILMFAITKVLMFYNENRKINIERIKAVEAVNLVEKQCMNNMSYDDINENISGKEMFITMDNFENGNHRTSNFINIMKERSSVDLSFDYIKVKAYKDEFYDVIIIDTEYVYINSPEKNIRHRFYRGKYETI